MSRAQDVPATWRELLGREHLGAAVVPAGGVLAGAINIYLAAGLLPTAVAELGGASFYAWNMTVYLVAMVIATMLTARSLSAWGTVGSYLSGFATFTAGSLACAVSPAMAVLLVSRGVQGLGAGLLSGLGFAVVRSALPARSGRAAPRSCRRCTASATSPDRRSAGCSRSSGRGGRRSRRWR
ncbi:hypothetical protein [Nonomuraea sp. NPDC049758]|uniref:hypothetical protein n=1 Tax=Nonomuraea sp. NPDC049758 TaxID=3154360 RepID=UPI0034292440